MRQHRVTSKANTFRKAFLAGVKETKLHLMETFIRIGRGELSGYTAHEIVKNANINVPRGT